MAALWSILLVDIKTVIHIIATRTINAFGGLVMFISCTRKLEWCLPENQ